MHRLEINGETLSVVEEGEGPAVLLVHSLGTSSALWASTLDALAPRFRVVAMDCRGHGASTNRGGFTVSAIATDALAVMSALGHERFHYVGLSMGGLFGVTAATRAAARILSLTLADSYATVGDAGLPRIAATRETLSRVSMQEFARAYVRDTLLTATPVDVHEQVARMISGMSRANYMQTLEAILTADVTPLLGLIKVPSLVLVGAEDKRTPPSVAGTLAEQIRGAELVILPSAGHLSVLDQPTLFNSTLARFLLKQSSV